MASIVGIMKESRRGNSELKLDWQLCSWNPKIDVWLNTWMFYFYLHWHQHKKQTQATHIPWDPQVVKELSNLLQPLPNERRLCNWKMIETGTPKLFRENGESLNLGPFSTSLLLFCLVSLLDTCQLFWLYQLSKRWDVSGSYKWCYWWHYQNFKQKCHYFENERI